MGALTDITATASMIGPQTFNWMSGNLNQTAYVTASQALGNSAR